jgi:serine/threonine-protein kinase RsbW
LRVPEPALFALKLALEECGSNIVNHSLQRDALQTFRVTFSRTGNSIIIELRDCGPEFDPTQVPAAEGNAVADDNRIGGWGIQLVRRSVDEMIYRRAGDENVLCLTKRLDALKDDPPADV